MGAENVTSPVAKLILSSRMVPEVPRVSTRRSLVAGNVASLAAPVESLPLIVTELPVELSFTTGLVTAVVEPAPKTAIESLPGETTAKIDWRGALLK